MFRPRSIAVIGASDDPRRIGGRPFAYLHGRYGGDLWPVNSSRDRVQGCPAVREVSALPAAPDLAVIAVPAPAVETTVKACLQRGARALMLLSAGFAETGEPGAAGERALAAMAGTVGVRMLGPNCLGFCNVGAGIHATFSSTLEHGFPAAGALGIVSQSGAYGSHCMVLAREAGVGISFLLTTGNECDVDAADCLAFLAADAATRVIVLALEGTRDGRRLRNALHMAERAGKPVVALKMGGSEAGGQAAASHTAVLAGNERVFAAVLEEAGAWRASSTEELMDVACALVATIDDGELPAGRRLGLITMSGGAGILMADAASARGLDVAPMPAAARARLQCMLPYAATANPVDTTAQIYNDMDLVRRFAEVMLEDGGYDLLVGYFQALGHSDALSDALAEALVPLRSRRPRKPFLLSLLATPRNLARLRAAGFVVLADPTRAITAAAALSYFGQRAGRATEPDLVPPTPFSGELPQDEQGARALLAAAGIPVVAAEFAADPEHAAAVAVAIGFPVVIKAVVPGLVHKTEAGGVMLGLGDAAAVQAAMQCMRERIAGSSADSVLSGVLVSPQVQGGVEMVIGAHRDPQFGWIVALGFGGIFTEVLDDVVLASAPVSPATAMRMLGRLRGRALLEGARGTPRCDLQALAQALSALSHLAHSFGERMDAVEVNPLLARAEGVLALDARVLPAAAV